MPLDHVFNSFRICTVCQQAGEGADPTCTGLPNGKTSR